MNISIHNFLKYIFKGFRITFGEHSLRDAYKAIVKKDQQLIVNLLNRLFGQV